VDNPFQSPGTVSSKSEQVRRGPSWIRGFVYAVPAFFAGAIIPLLLPVIYLAYTWVSGEEFDSALFDSALVAPSVGCGMLFSFAAIRNQSPSEATGFVTCLMAIGVFGIVGLIFSTLVAFAFSLGTQTYDSDPWLPIRALLAISIPACYTYVSTQKRMLVSMASNTEHSA